MTDSLARIVPEVQTLARPTSGSLLAARNEIQRSAALQAAFEHARKTDRTPEQLAGDITPELERVLDTSPEDAVETAQYLADEYFQIGDALLVIDKDTGRALARFTDEDIYTPAAVPREDGTMAQPLPRLHPGLEAFLVSHHYDNARDAQLLARVRAKYPNLSFDAGDSRLRAITRAGRASLIDTVRERLPSLLGAVQGAAKGFLDHFDISETPPPGRTAGVPRSTAIARSQQSISDPLTFNLQHDRVQALQARIGTAWVREIAAKVASVAPVFSRRTLPCEDIRDETLAPANFWIVPPSAYSTFLPFTAHGLLPVEGVEPTGLVGKVGTIVIEPSGYSIQAREVFARWEILAHLEYVVYLDADKIIGLVVPDIHVENIAEIV